MTQAQATAITAALVESGMGVTQALATAMAMGKVADLKAEGYECTDADISIIAANARVLAEAVVAKQHAAQGAAFVSTLR